ncbi:MAG: hypothetical protein KAQ69_11060, partial [Spirochaetales bacterium]|nr:hypothetical protein [Spirochaetales bacterium]
MPKSMTVDPAAIRKEEILTLKSIPMNSYKPDADKELKLYGKSGLINMYRDMLLIREFETMLDLIKREGKYEG